MHRITYRKHSLSNKISFAKHIFVLHLKAKHGKIWISHLKLAQFIPYRIEPIFCYRNEKNIIFNDFFFLK